MEVIEAGEKKSWLFQARRTFKSKKKLDLDIASPSMRKTYRLQSQTPP